MSRPTRRTWLTRRGVGVLALWLSAAALAAAPRATPSAADPSQVAHDVFQDSDFWWKHTERVDSNPSWIVRLTRAISDFIAQIVRTVWEWIRQLLLGLFHVVAGDWSSVSALIWLVVAALLAWVLWKTYPLVRLWLQQNAPASARKERPEYEQLPEAAALFQNAGQAFREGRYAEAIRLALLALIARWQHEGLLRYDPARTNREYQGDLHSRPQLAALFAEVARPYERTWYGLVPATPAEAERVLEQCRPIVNEEAAHA